MMKFKIFSILAQCSKKSKGVISFLYWLLYILLLVVLIEYFHMFRIEDGMIAFDMDYLHMAGIFLITVIFFSLDKTIQKHILILEPKSKSEQKQKSKKKQKQESKSEQGSDEMAFDYEDMIILDETPQEEKVIEKPKNKVKQESPVITEQYFRLNSFEQQARGVQDFMNSCYHNTFRITLPEKIHGYAVPDEFRSFYLHFEFKDDKNHSLCEDVIQKKFIWELQEFDGSDELVYAVQIPYHTQLDRNVRVPASSDYFSIGVKFKLNGSEIHEFGIDIPENKVSFLGMVKHKLKYFFFREQPVKNRSSNASRFKTDFQNTTRLNPIFTNDNSEFLFYHREKVSKYCLEVSCYHNFSMITCPVCHNPVHDLGIPGIVLYKNLSPEIIQTSDEILKYLNQLDNSPELNKNEKNLLTMVKFATKENIGNNVIIPGNTGDGTDLKLEQVKEHIRIPLGRYHYKNKTVKAFTCHDFTEEQEFLQQFNRAIHKNFDHFEDTHKGLYLLKPGSVTPATFEQFYIHNSMIAQLCSKCWNPLPEKFYDYDAVVTIYFFGNSNAGKTVLLCSGYNMIQDENQNKKPQDKMLNKFNIIYLHTGKATSAYEKKAESLRSGTFPAGTSQNDAIPGKLSSAKIYRNEVHCQYMFNDCDMPGIKSVENWASFRNFAYVHTLLDDTLSLGEDSFYHTLSGIVPVGSSGDESVDARTYNMQLYLTKIDEYPLFLYQKIKALNDAWGTWQKKGLVGNYMKNTLIYTLELLGILEQELEQEFIHRPANEIIPEKIQTCIKAMHSEQLQQLDFSKKYYVIHDIIVTECIDRKDIQAIAVLNYLHGLDVIRDNYMKFRELIKSTIKNMHNNAYNNYYSNYFFCVYAVSATGYSAVESNSESRPEYRAEFVKESHEMLQHTTYEFEIDNREMKKNISSSQKEVFEIGRCREYLFSKFSVTEPDFQHENFQNTGSESIAERIAKLYRKPFVHSDLYADDFETLMKKLEISAQPDSVKKLHQWYANHHFAPEHNEAVLT